jgi:hypothetical protein
LVGSCTGNGLAVHDHLELGRKLHRKIALTGFANFEAPLGGKWLELLSEIAPGGGRSMFNENIRLCLPEHPPEASTPATARRLLVLSASFSILGTRALRGGGCDLPQRS